MFYSRIPCPSWVDHSEEYLNKATRFFPLIGWIVAAFSIGVYSIFWYLNEPVLAIIFSMVATIWITGAFHEDGFADVCDGFGGGWTKEKILSIMKDSRVGAYGLIGMVMLLAIKFFLIYRFQQETEAELLIVSIFLLSGHSLSRFVAATFIFTHEYSRDDATSKVKPVGKKISITDLVMAGIFGIAPLFLFNNFWVFLSVPVVYLAKVRLGIYFQKWIDGYTGDCLGATQQICEVVFYLSTLMIWKYI